ncbi:hypothetical protein [Moorena sp. SIO1G6]|nr:hypothetical protein [Moorena sp. SIO1G6]
MRIFDLKSDRITQQTTSFPATPNPLQPSCHNQLHRKVEGD